MAPTRSPKRITAASFLAQCDQLSIELSKLVMDPVDVKEHLSRFTQITTPSSDTIQSLAKMFHKSSTPGAFAIKTKLFGSNQLTMFDERIRSFDFDGSVKLVDTKVTPIATVPQTADRIDLITRFSFDLVNHSN
jgi:hypothetical protein